MVYASKKTVTIIVNIVKMVTKQEKIRCDYLWSHESSSPITVERNLRRKLIRTKH